MECAYKVANTAAIYILILALITLTNHHYFNWEGILANIER